MTDDLDRAAVLVTAVKIALSDTVGDPEALVRMIADKTLDDDRRATWWAILLDAAQKRDLDRAGIASVILIFGEPPTLTASSKRRSPLSDGWAA